MQTRFKNYYNIVFDKDGNVKPCGREAVRNLIIAADSLEPNVKHGDIHTCFMKEHLIKNLHVLLNPV